MLKFSCKQLFALAALGFGSLAQSATLYDGSLGTTPSAQGWSKGVVGLADESMIGNAVNLNTTVLGNGTSAGYSVILADVDSTAGFGLRFQAQVLAESHSGNSNRAGFSVILLDNQHKGVELGFWTDQVWAQAVGFTKAESAVLNTTAMTDYWLDFSGTDYRFGTTASETPLLTGSLRDYSSAGLVYVFNNFVFMGDDTSSAQANFKIASVSSVPLPSALGLLLGPLGLGAMQLLRSKKSKPIV